MDIPTGAADLVHAGGRRDDVWSAGDAGPIGLPGHGIPTDPRLWGDVAPGVAR